jgi:hypothetical protein
VRERLEEQDLDNASGPAPGLRRREQPREQTQRIVQVAVGALLTVAGDQ